MSSIKKCPECGGRTEIFGDAFAEFWPKSGGVVQKNILLFKMYNCVKCGEKFSENVFKIPESGKIKNLRVILKT